MAIDDSPTKEGDITVHDGAPNDSDKVTDYCSRIQEFETTQTSLLELLFKIVKDRADDVGKDEYLRLLENDLKKLKRTTEQLRERLKEAELENRHLAVAAKMYKADSEMRNCGVAQETATSLQDGYEPRLVDQIPQLLQGGKRSFEEMQSESEDQPVPSALKSAKQHVSVCISCFRNGRRCNDGEPCNSCLENRSKCQRARCANYKAGTCRIVGCTQVHEDDKQKYKNTVYAGHVSKKAKVCASRQVDDGSKKPSKRKGRMAMGILVKDF